VRHNERGHRQSLNKPNPPAVFDCLRRDATRTASDVAAETGLVPTLLYRLLRALASLGLLNEMPGHQLEYAVKGIRVNTVLSAIIETDMTAIARGDEQTPNGLLLLHPVRRFGALAVDLYLNRDWKEPGGLGIDYIDLYQMLGFDTLSPVEGTLGALDDMARSCRLQLDRRLGSLFPSSYGLRKTSASDGCQQSTATRAFSAAARKGTQSGQTRAAKSESQNCSSTFFGIAGIGRRFSSSKI
jgi:IclR helix-turn-helix domain